MSVDYKVGDRVERFRDGSHNQINMGDTGIVTEICGTISTTVLLDNGYSSMGHSISNLRLFKPTELTYGEKKLKVGDFVRGLRNDIAGCEGYIDSIIKDTGDIIYDHCTIKLTKLGNKNWHDGTNPGWQVGKTSRSANWDLELITPKELIKDNMDTEIDTRVENIEPAVLREAQAQALKEIKEEQSLRAKQYFKEQYAKKTDLENQKARKQLEIDAIDKELAEVLKGLKPKK